MKQRKTHRKLPTGPFLSEEPLPPRRTTVATERTPSHQHVNPAPRPPSHGDGQAEDQPPLLAEASALLPLPSPGRVGTAGRGPGAEGSPAPSGSSHEAQSQPLGALGRVRVDMGLASRGDRPAVGPPARRPGPALLGGPPTRAPGATAPSHVTSAALSALLLARLRPGSLRFPREAGSCLGPSPGAPAHRRPPSHPPLPRWPASLLSLTSALLLQL